MVSAATAGFRGPAKRAAFGDVTNVSRQSVATRDDGKVTTKVSTKAVPAVLSTLAPIGTNLNKENGAQGKDSLARLAQRTAAPANKNKVISERKSIQPLKSTSHTQRPFAQQSINNAAATLPSSYISKEDQDQVHALLPSTTTRPFKQPRHHKSQPQLKFQQPSLRRTQSKFLEKIDYESTTLDIPEESELKELHVSTLEQASGHTIYFDTGSYHLGSDSQSQAHEVERMVLATNCSAILDARPTTGQSFKESSYPALSEPEEWDEEEDEEYDDKDQVYITAHSFRTRDYNSIDMGVTTLLAPKFTTRVQRELEEARIEVEDTRMADDFEEEAWDVSMVAEYGDDIFDYLRELEASRH